MENSNNVSNITGIRIREMRLDKNWTQKDLANKLGLKNETAIANYESGYSIPKDEIKLKICEIFNCSIDYLMGKSNFKTKEEEFKSYANRLHNSALLDIAPDLLKIGVKEEDILNLLHISLFDNKDRFWDVVSQIKDSLLNKQSKKKFENLIDIYFDEIRHQLEFDRLKDFKQGIASKYYMCPVYGQIPAGEPNWAEECIEGRLPIDPNLMDIVNPEECYFLKVNGESMNKVISNGAYALIRKTDWVENGEIAVILVNGYDATLKKFTKKGDVVVLEPMSNDPSFQTQIYDKNTPIKIIGKYIGKFEMKN